MGQPARKLGHREDLRRIVTGFLEKKNKLPAGGTLDSFNYIDSGHVDSMGIIQFVVSLESEFGIEITDQEMESPAFRTVGGILDLLETKLR